MMRIALIQLMTSRLASIVSGELYAPGDFRYTDVESALALDFALLRMKLLSEYSTSIPTEMRLEGILEATLDSGIREHGLQLSAQRVLALAVELGDMYFLDSHWLWRLRPDLITVITARTCFAPINKAQADLRAGLALILAYDLEILHLALEDIFGASHDLAGMVEERAQMNALFHYRYGCVSLADAGLEEAEEERLPVKFLMLPMKRVFDVVVTLALCLLISPLIILLVAILSFEDGPIFYSQKRIGRNGRIFGCHKFRTMVPNAELLLAELIASDPAAHAEWQMYEKLRNDPRTTPLGRFLRRSSLDEIPQLFNVLKGQMSLVGPRPMAVHERDRWGGLYRCYTAVPPGVTGPWQIFHRTDSDYGSRISSLRQYISEWSVISDIRYLFLTLKIPFLRRGAY